MQKTITDFEQLQCWRLAMKMYYLMNAEVRKKKMDPDSELVCRWLVSSLQISGKIALAFGAEDHERFLEWLPLAKKYCFECAFRTSVMQQKGLISKTKAKEYQTMIKVILKKVTAIIRYLEKYGYKEQYDRQMFFERVER